MRQCLSGAPKILRHSVIQRNRLRQKWQRFRIRFCAASNGTSLSIRPHALHPVSMYLHPVLIRSCVPGCFRFRTSLPNRLILCLPYILVVFFDFGGDGSAIEGNVERVAVGQRLRINHRFPARTNYRITTCLQSFRVAGRQHFDIVSKP